jgi:hypothetical protein
MCHSTIGYILNDQVERRTLSPLAWFRVGRSNRYVWKRRSSRIIQKVISDFADAWNRHDAKAMAELHTAT